MKDFPATHATACGAPAPTEVVWSTPNTALAAMCCNNHVRYIKAIAHRKGVSVITKPRPDLHGAACEIVVLNDVD